MIAHPFVRVNLNILGGHFMNTFASRLRELRKERGLTQKQLAEQTGASERGIQNYELGVRSPAFDVLISLADFFDVSLDYLCGRSDWRERG